MNTIGSKRKHLLKFTLSTIFVFLLLECIGQVSGFQHPSPTPTVYSGWSKSLKAYKSPTKRLYLVSVAGDIDTRAEDHQSPPPYDWDEQFEELKLFMAKYGHCNFPPNPPKQLEKKYPMLKRFCQDQRKDYKVHQNNIFQKKIYVGRVGKSCGMSLVVFDREIRCRRLEELGFAFNQITPAWYDHYHELIQYISDNGHIRVTKDENAGLTQWVNEQRCRRKGTLKSRTRLSDKQIKLLDNIGFEWEPEVYAERWYARYLELVAFRKKHGNFLMMDQSSSLYKWMHHQRRRRLTDEQMKLLDDVSFPWKPEINDVRWQSTFEDLKRFRKKYGHSRPERTENDGLYLWSRYQSMKHQKGQLPPEKVRLLEEIDFPWERKTVEWPRMLGELTEFYNTHGHLQVNQEDDPDLFDWMDVQRKRYRSTLSKQRLNDEQIEKLEELHFCWSLDWRDRSWHEKYTEAVEFFKEHGHIRVTKKDSLSLYNWVAMQEKRYKGVKEQKPLSEEELEMLEQVDFPFLIDQPRMAWNTKHAELERYRKEHGGQFPSHKDDPNLNRWMRQQRYRYRCAYGYAPLSDEQTKVLDSSDFPKYPIGKRRRFWYEKYDDLVDFWKQHGHFTVEDPILKRWISKQRLNLKGESSKSKPLSRMELYLLERIGFAWVSDRHEVEWEMIYDELAQFVETRGHIPRFSENYKIATWVANQRRKYKGKNSFHTLLKQQIDKLEEIDGWEWSPKMGRRTN